MKKIYVMAAFLGTGLFVFGQTAEYAVKAAKEVRTAPLKPAISSNYQAKALAKVFWHDNFDSIMHYDGTDSTFIPSVGFWNIDNDGETAADRGWIIGATDEGHFEIGTDFTSTSGEAYAQVNNGGDPTEGVEGAMDVTYTLTSGPIDIDALIGGTGVLLSFEQLGAGHNDKQTVEISLNGTDWTPIYDNQHKEVHTLYPNPDAIELDLEPFLTAPATTVHLRFSWTSGSSGAFLTNPWAWFTYGWVIDDIQLAEKADHDLVYISSDYHYTNAQYAQVPSDQVSDMTVQTVFKNQGVNDLTNIVLYVLEGTDTVGTSAPLATLAAGDTDSLEVVFTPDNTEGIKTYTLSLGLTETDDNPDNNLIAKEIKLDVNEFIYAADHYGFGAPVYEYELSIPLEGGTTAIYESVGVLYDIYTDRLIGGVDVAILEGTGSEVFVGLEVAGTTSWEPVGQEIPYEIQSSDLAKIITLPFDTPFLLEAGNTYRVYVNTFGNEEVVLASAGETSQPAQILFREGAGDYIYINNMYDIPIIRMNFDETVSTIENKMSNLNVSQNFPNPFANETTVLFNLKETAHVSYTVVDLTGKVVANVDKGATMAGNHEIIIDGSSFANGVYYLNINAGDSKVTRKMIVNK